MGDVLSFEGRVLRRERSYEGQRCYLEEQIFSESESIKSKKEQDKNSLDSEKIKVTAKRFKREIPNFQYKDQIEDLNEQLNRQMLDKKVSYHLRTARTG